MKYEPNIEMVPIGGVVPYPNNPRSRDKKQIKALAASIERNGFNAAIVIDEQNVIINGHGRYEAALLLKLTHVPVIRVTHLSDGEKRAYRIVDNKLGAQSQWNTEKLAIEFTMVLGAGLSLENTTSFTTGEIDHVLGAAQEAKGPDIAPEDALPEALRAPPVSRRGDVWILGDHRLMCADARDDALLTALMGAEQARAIFTDPPYNVKIEGFASPEGRHREFAMASGEMSAEEFSAFLTQVMSIGAAACVDGAILFVCMDWRHMRELLAAADAAALRLMNLCVWAKTNGGMGSFYRSQHELIFVLKKGDAPHLNTFELGQGGRYRTNLWSYRGANSFGPTRDEDLAAHPTVKPTALVADAIKDVTGRGDIVLDMFGGSGTTIIAAEMTGRRARAMEIAPGYVDLAIRRFQKATGKHAVHAQSGLTFEDEAEARSS